MKKAEETFIKANQKRFDQAHAKAPLQLLHLLADGGLGQVELARGRGKPAETDDFHKGADLVEAEMAHKSSRMELKETLINFII